MDADEVMCIDNEALYLASGKAKPPRLVVRHFFIKCSKFIPLVFSGVSRSATIAYITGSLFSKPKDFMAALSSVESIIPEPSVSKTKKKV